MEQRILLAIDRPGWTFHSISQQICDYLSDTYKFKIGLIGQLSGECDILVLFWWNALPELLPKVRYKHLILAIYDHLSWARTESDRVCFQQAINHASIITACNSKLIEEITNGPFQFRDKPILLMEDGVDTVLFPQLPLPEEFRVGWCGNSAVGYGRVKGLDLIVDACEQANVPLSVMDCCNCGSISHWAMPSWYRDISCYINTSIADGTPNPPLEAMACGRPVISTRVGILDRVIQPGYNGYFIERSSEDLVGALRKIQQQDLNIMGGAARKTVERDWTWRTKIQAWRQVFDRVIQTPTKVTTKIVKHRPRGLLVCDVPGWAFAINEEDMAEYCSNEYLFDIYDLISKRPPPSMKKYSFAFLPYHRWYLDHYWQSAPVLGSLRSQWFDPKQPEVVPEQDAAFIRRCHGFQVCYLGAYRELHEKFPQVVYLTNPINMRKFSKVTQITDKIICEWNGNAAHGQEDASQDIKGIHHIIRPVCQELDIELRTVEFNSNRIKHSEMNDFYCQANVALCASKYEGASNSVMEAMASGLAVIATDVGNHREMQYSQYQHFGDVGILLVDRNKESFGETLSKLTPERVVHMGNLNRKEIEMSYSWDVWYDKYNDFFRMAL